MSTLGRKWTLAALSVPLTLGFALFLAADATDDALPIHVGRFLHGRQPLFF